MLPSQQEIEQRLLPSLQLMEEDRKLAFSHYKQYIPDILLITFFRTIFFAFPLLILYNNFTLPFFIASSLFVTAFLFFSCRSHLKKQQEFLKTFEVKVKTGVYQEMFLTLNKSCSYQPTQFITEEVFRQSNLFASGYGYKGDDYCTGTLEDGRSFEFSELAAGKHSFEKNSTTYEDDASIIFKGLFLIINGPHNLPHTNKPTVIVPTKQQDYHQKTTEKVATPHHNILDADFITPIKEEVKRALFDQIYQVECANNVNIRQNLSEEFCAQLNYIKTGLRQQVFVSIQTNKIYIALPSPFSFWVVNIKKPLMDTQQVQHLAWNFKMAFEVLERLSSTTTLDNPSR